VGFVILNGIEFNADGGIVPQDHPYPGSNLFSLASGGAIYLRDPHQKVVESQLNGGVFSSSGRRTGGLSGATWRRTSACSASPWRTC